MIWPNTWLSREPTFSFQSFVSELHFVTWESGSGAIDADVGHQRDWLLSFYGTSGPAKVQTALNEIIIVDKKKKTKKGRNAIGWRPGNLPVRLWVFMAKGATRRKGRCYLVFDSISSVEYPASPKGSVNATHWAQVATFESTAIWIVKQLGTDPAVKTEASVDFRTDATVVNPLNIPLRSNYVWKFILFYSNLFFKKWKKLIIKLKIN